MCILFIKTTTKLNTLHTLCIAIKSKINMVLIFYKEPTGCIPQTFHPTIDTVVLSLNNRSTPSQGYDSTREKELSLRPTKVTTHTIKG
jgi:hypothetical protein